MSQRPSAPSPAPWKESHPAHRRQSVSAPQARPREITDATAVPCRRRGIKPSPPLRSLSHHPTTPARWPSALTGALPTRPAPGRSSRLDPLAKETLPESCIEQNPPAIVRQAIFRLLNESGYISGQTADIHRIDKEVHERAYGLCRYAPVFLCCRSLSRVEVRHGRLVRATGRVPCLLQPSGHSSVAGCFVAFCSVVSAFGSARHVMALSNQ